MTDKEIVQGLINRDETVTREFFFTGCRPLFLSIIRPMMSIHVRYGSSRMPGTILRII